MCENECPGRFEWRPASGNAPHSGMVNDSLALRSGATVDQQLDNLA